MGKTEHGGCHGSRSPSVTILDVTIRRPYYVLDALHPTHSRPRRHLNGLNSLDRSYSPTTLNSQLFPPKLNRSRRSSRRAHSEVDRKTKASSTTNRNGDRLHPGLKPITSMHSGHGARKFFFFNVKRLPIYTGFAWDPLITAVSYSL